MLPLKQGAQRVLLLHPPKRLQLQYLSNTDHYSRYLERERERERERE